MASKKKAGRDDFNFDEDLDFDIPDFGGDDPSVTKNDRKPITQGLKSAAAGFGKSFTDEARIRKTLSRSLPDSYEEPLSKAFEIKNGAKDLYNIGSQQANELVRESKRSIGRIGKNLEGMGPKWVTDRMIKWGSTADGEYNHQASKDEVEKNTIDSALAEIFTQSLKSDAVNRRTDDARNIVQDNIERKRHQDMTSILGSVDQSLISMVTFQENVQTNFLKKTLEIQFRTYFIQSDMLKLQTKYFQEFKDDLGAITKNTGLPDYVKKAPKEALFELMRTKTFDSLANTLSKKRNQWLQGAFKKAGTKIKEKGEQLRENASTIFDQAEMMSSMAGSGMGPSLQEIAGDAAGGYAGGKLQDFIAKKIRAKMVANPKAMKMGNQLTQVTRGLPQWVNQQMHYGKYNDKIPDFIKEILALDGENTSVNVSKEVDLERAARWSDKSARTLNVVIPELLSMTLREITMLRTGNTGVASLKYDYEKGKFVTQKERNAVLAKTIVSDKTINSTKGSIDNLFKAIDPEGTLDAATRKELAANIYKANKDNTYFDANSMRSEHILGSGEGARKAGALIKKHLDATSSGYNERTLSTLFNKVGGDSGDTTDVIQHLIDSGRAGELEDMGILDIKTGQINLDAIRKMELGDGYKEAAPAPTLGNQKQSMKQKLKNMMNLQSDQNQNVPNHSDAVAESMKLMREATESLNNTRSNGTTTSAMSEKLEQAIAGASGKTELMEIRDILLRIEAIGGMAGGHLTQEQFQQLLKNSTGGMMSNIGGKIGGMIKGGAKALWKGGMASQKLARSGIGSAAKLGWKGATGAFNMLRKAKSSFDLYIGTEVEPRLSKAKMKARRYVDEATGDIIEKFEDIKGNVKDLDTGEIVLKATELKDAALRNLETGKAFAIKGLGWGKKAISAGYEQAKKTIGSVIGLGKSVYGMAWTVAKGVYNKLTDGPMDVYVKDKYDSPALLKRIMAEGRYFDKATLDPITKVSEIKGPVLDNDGNVALSKEELALGLYDKDGNEIKTGMSKILGMLTGSAGKAIGAYKKLLGKGMDMVGGAFSWVGSLFGKGSPITMTTRKTNDILSAIYGLLNDRLPGDRSPDLDSIMPKGSGPDDGSGGIRSKVRGAFGNMRDRVKGLFDRGRDKSKELLSDDNIQDVKDKVNDKYGKGKGKVISAWDRMYKLMDERFPKVTKKRFDDIDGDGVREGSYEDQRSKREKIKDAAAAAKAGAMAKGKSGYDMLANLFKKKQKDDDEDDDDDGGDTFIDNSGGDGEKKKTAKELKDEKRKRRIQRLKDKKPKGRFGKAWQGVKNSKIGKWGGKLGGLGRGLAGGALGTAARTAGGFGLRAAGMWGLSLLTGGLASAGMVSTLGGLAMSGLGMIGSVLGVAATAIGAVISSPITVPALAIAAIGTAGYFAYKWLTKPDPQPLEKVRLVQYGWKSDNLEAYKKMKTLEEKVKTAVVFKGENAEFDSKKIDIPALMKVYDLDPKNADHAKKFVAWFADRFRPLYLHHAALVKILALPKPLEDIDSNKADLKKQYLEQCLFPGDHYSVSTSPFKDQTYLTTSESTVQKEIDSAKAIVATEGTKKPEDDKKAAAKATPAAVLAATTAAAQKKELDGENQKAKDDVVGVPNNFGSQSGSTERMTRLAAATIGAQALNNNTGGGSQGGSSNPISGPAGPGGASTQGGGSFSGGIGLSQPGNGTGGDINSIPIPKGNGSWAALRDTVVASAKMVGIDPKLAASIIAVESGFDASARPYNKKTGGYFSSAKGLNQFIDGTWKGMMKKYASKYGIDPNTSAMDPRANALMGAEFLKENMAGLKKVVNRDLTATDVYIAHFMGMGGAKKFLSADPNSSGAALFPDAAKANPWIYYKDPKSMQSPKTLGEIYSDFTGKLSKKLSASGYSDSDAGAALGDPEKIKADNAAALAGGEGKSGQQMVPEAKPTGVPISSPKPVPSNTSGPNAGPTPKAYESSSSQPISSPKPSGYSEIPTGRAPAIDPFYRSNNKANTGDGVGSFKEVNDNTRSAADSLVKVVELLTTLPGAIAKALMEPLAESSSSAPVKPEGEKNNYGHPPSPLSNPSIAFKRKFAGN